MVNSTAFHQQI